MKTLLAVAIPMVLAAELLALTQPDRRYVPWATGAVVAVTLLTVRWLLVRSARVEVDESRARDPAVALGRWLTKTEILVARAESNRSDWDKHLRPMLARQFELATGQRKSKDPKVFKATALVLFGEELWPWVDPDNVSRTGADEPGPGRAVLDDVLQRLERL